MTYALGCYAGVASILAALFYLRGREAYKRGVKDGFKLAAIKYGAQVEYWKKAYCGRVRR